ncbi:hypothetical protein D3C87_1726810 [compost metagenome]
MLAAGVGNKLAVLLKHDKIVQVAFDEQLHQVGFFVAVLVEIERLYKVPGLGFPFLSGKCNFNRLRRNGRIVIVLASRGGNDQ